MLDFLRASRLSAHGFVLYLAPGAGCEILAISSQGEVDGLPAHGNVQRRKSDLEVRPGGSTASATRVHLLGELHPGVLVQVRWNAKACENKTAVALRSHPAVALGGLRPTATFSQFAGYALSNPTNRENAN